jgi:hypothetical protein
MAPAPRPQSNKYPPPYRTERGDRADPKLAPLDPATDSDQRGSSTSRKAATTSAATSFYVGQVLI